MTVINAHFHCNSKLLGRVYSVQLLNSCTIVDPFRVNVLDKLLHISCWEEHWVKSKVLVLHNSNQQHIYKG